MSGDTDHCEGMDLYSFFNDFNVDFDTEDSFQNQDPVSLPPPLQSENQLDVGPAGSSLLERSPFDAIFQQAWSGAILATQALEDSSEVADTGSGIDPQRGGKSLVAVTKLREPGTRQRGPRTHWGINKTTRLASLKKAGFQMRKIAQILKQEFPGLDVNHKKCSDRWSTIRKDFLTIAKHEEKAQADTRIKSYWTMNARDNSLIKLQSSFYDKRWYDAVKAVEADKTRKSTTAQPFLAAGDSSIDTSVLCSSDPADDVLTGCSDEIRNYSSNHSTIMTEGVVGRLAPSKVNRAVGELDEIMCAASTAGDMLFSANEKSVEMFLQQSKRRRRPSAWETGIEAKRQRDHTAWAP